MSEERPRILAPPVTAASRPNRFRRGVLWGMLALGLGQFVLDESPIADWLLSPLFLADTSGQADAIVVLGAGVVGPCVPNVSAVRRTLMASDLWRQGRAPLVLFTGGRPSDSDCPVASIMAELGTRLGIPADHVIVETGSRTTLENALYAGPMLDALQVRRVVLVTDRLHMLRASLVFGARGYDVERAGVPVYATHHGNLDMLWGGLREYVALAYYRVNGWFASLDRREPGHQSGSTGMPPPVSPRFPDGPIVILGASYAAGWNPTTLASRPAINKGVTGQQSFELAERFDADVVSASPRAVIVWGFINDVFRAPVSDVDAALARARASITRMIERGRAEGVEVILTTEVTITGRDSWMERLASLVGPLLGKTSHQDRINHHVADTNRWIRDTARSEGLLLLDFETIMSGPDGRRRRDFAQDDGSHLTPLAYEVLDDYAQPLVSRHLARRVPRTE